MCVRKVKAMEQYMPFIWIGFAVLMIICEAFTTQLVSIWFVIGAACAAVTTIFTDSILIQSTVFLIVSLVALIVTKPLVKRFKSSRGRVSTNADRLIGQTGVMLSDIDDVQQVGQAKVEGEIWTVKSGKTPLKKNSKITVLSIEGVKLIVEPIE